ncbi:MAG: hypothetical protein LAO07_04830 [Acidobacteriia bacterium]|nr:hypothetical protein [Terriglobia bacterium]
MAVLLHAILRLTGDQNMPASQVYQAFKRASCVQLFLFAELGLSKSLISKLKNCVAGKRRNLPYRFAGVHPGEGKDKVGASATLRRKDRSRFMLELTWFETNVDPPAEFGRFSDLINCIGVPFGDREAAVVAIFSYEMERVTSLFKPIQLLEQPMIFDEITGFTGVKRNPEGKLVYEMGVSFGEKRLQHIVRFTQTIKLTEDIPLLLLETATKISALALKAKGGQ